MIKYLQLFEIEVTFKSGFNPSGGSTIITKEADITNKKLIITQDNLTLFEITNKENNNNYRDNQNTFLNYFEQYHNSLNTLYLSSTFQMFIVDRNFPLSIEQNLLNTNLFHKSDVICITLYNFSYHDYLDVTKQSDPEIHDSIISLFVNPKKKLIKIIMHHNEIAESKFLKSFIQKI